MYLVPDIKKRNRFVVIWSDPAKQDLKCIYNYISNDSRFYAKKVLREFIKKADKLIEFPEMGREVPEIEGSGIRELIVYSYRLMYEIGNDNTISILAIVHGKQNFSGF